uniref:Uncharacterized protein n=1 Tax=Romanomermis culicivorax TaxID=13658 RepID=A0A915HKV8_ROMCU
MDDLTRQTLAPIAQWLHILTHNLKIQGSKPSTSKDLLKIILIVKAGRSTDFIATYSVLIFWANAKSGNQLTRVPSEPQATSNSRLDSMSTMALEISFIMDSHRGQAFNNYDPMKNDGTRFIAYLNEIYQLILNLSLFKGKVMFASKRQLGQKPNGLTIKPMVVQMTKTGDEREIAEQYLICIIWPVFPTLSLSTTLLEGSLMTK